MNDIVLRWPAIARARESRPVQFTSRPDEAEVVERLRAADLSQLYAEALLGLTNFASLRLRHEP
jgi:hypothetical protein